MVELFTLLEMQVSLTSNWNAYLFNVASGQLGPRIEPKSASWSITINETEELSMTFNKRSLPKLQSKNWIRPWWAGVVLLYKNVPIFAGPITANPVETMDTISVACKGIRAVLAKRYVVRERPSWLELRSLDNMAAWGYKYTNLSYGTLAKRAVSIAQTKPGGSLPIRYAVKDIAEIDPTKDSAGNDILVTKRPHTRYWYGQNMQSMNCEAILQELSDVDNGTDILFKPVLFDENTIGWYMYTGLGDDHPNILQDKETTWDTTSNKGDITDLSLSSSGVNMVHRVFGIGSGSGAGTIIEVGQNLTQTTQLFPLLEGTVSASTTNRGQVKSLADSTVRSNQKPMHQFDATVRADGATRLGQFWPGEIATIITKGWYGLKDGENSAKILTMSGDLSNSVKIGFKERTG